MQKLLPTEMLAFFGLFLGAQAAELVYHSVVFSGGEYKLVDGIAEDSLAHGAFSDELFATGWDRLFIHAVKAKSDLSAAYAAGYLEGALTAPQIYDHYISWYDYTFKHGTQPPTQQLIDFIWEQYAWARKMIEENPDDEYWFALDRTLTQFDGIVSGMNNYAAKGESLSKWELLLLQACGDVYDLIPATNPSLRVQWNELSKENHLWAWHQSVSCSAIVKITSDLSEAFSAHTTWTSYQNMLRVFKHYDLGAYRVSFSAKPSVLYSKDDFHVLPNKDQQMVVTETTNGNMNNSLYDLIVPETLLTWQRVPLANSIATSGEEWTRLFDMHQSGTYMNQYIITDMKRFGEKDGFVWIDEQIPGMARRQDVTSNMYNQGLYWPSYNVPFNDDIYVTSGFLAAYEKYGDDYSYENCVRAKMMRRDQGLLATLTDVEKFIRYNDYEVDPLSEDDPMNAIACRKDLEPTGATTFGSIDGKVCSKSSMTLGGVSYAQSGPTHDIQPVFSWDPTWSATLHAGQPDTFDYGWEMMEFDD